MPDGKFRRLEKVSNNEFLYNFKDLTIACCCHDGDLFLGGFSYSFWTTKDGSKINNGNIISSWHPNVLSSNFRCAYDHFPFKSSSSINDLRVGLARCIKKIKQNFPKIKIEYIEDIEEF